MAAPSGTAKFREETSKNAARQSSAASQVSHSCQTVARVFVHRSNHGSACRRAATFGLEGVWTRPEVTKVPSDTHKPCRKTLLWWFPHKWPIQRGFPAKPGRSFCGSIRGRSGVCGKHMFSVVRLRIDTCCERLDCQGFLNLRKPFAFCLTMRTERPFRSFWPRRSPGMSPAPAALRCGRGDSPSYDLESELFSERLIGAIVRDLLA